MKNIVAVALCIVFSSLFISQSFAQANAGVIRGAVSYKGEPLSGVNIAIMDLLKGSFSDTNGEYQIRKVTPGKYSLRASFVGFKEVQREVEIKAGKILTVNIEMEEVSSKLGDLVVTGTMRETFVRNSPVKVEVVNVRRLQQGKVSANFMDLIGNVNGLSTQLNCGVCGTNAIRINGVEGPNTAVLIDGMPILGALASVYGLNGISPSIIDQVEVIKGPQSTLYGTQALGGVVNIITKNPINTPTFVVEAYGESTTREGNINIAASPKMGRFNGFLSADINRNNHYFDHNDDGFNDRPNQMRVALFGKGILESPIGEQRLNVAVKYLNEDRMGGVLDFSDALRGSNTVYGESIYTRRAELLAEYRPPGLSERLRINTAFTYHSQDSFYGSTAYDATQNIAFGQATWAQPLTEDVRLLLGSTLRYETYDDNTPATLNGADLRFTPGVFTQTEITSGEVTLLAGLRLDHHSEHGLVTAPRLSVKYSPTELTTFRASAGTGFRVVHIFTEDHAALTGSRQVIFKEDLAPERSKSITASVEHILPFGVNPLTLTIDGFHTHFSNQIIPDYDQDSNLIVYENLDGYSVTRGFSVGIEQNFTDFPLSYNVGFTLMDVFKDEHGVKQALTYAPDFLGNIGATYQFRGIFTSLSYSGNLIGSKRMPDNYVNNFSRARQSPVYSTHDLKITKEFMDVNDAQGVGFEVFLSVKNMFDFTQETPLIDAENPFSPEFDTIYTWGPIVGRTFSVGARLNLR